MPDYSPHASNPLPTPRHCPPCHKDQIPFGAFWICGMGGLHPCLDVHRRMDDRQAIGDRCLRRADAVVDQQLPIHGGNRIHLDRLIVNDDERRVSRSQQMILDRIADGFTGYALSPLPSLANRTRAICARLWFSARATRIFYDLSSAAIPRADFPPAMRATASTPAVQSRRRRSRDRTRNTLPVNCMHSRAVTAGTISTRACVVLLRS